MRVWQLHGQAFGLVLQEDHDRLTNFRLADDILLFAPSRLQCTDMLPSLVEALENDWLFVNATRT